MWRHKLVLLTFSRCQFLISDLNAEFLLELGQSFFQNAESLLELLTLLTEHERTDSCRKHLILRKIEQGPVLPGLLVQLLLLEEAVLNLFLDHVEVIAESSQVGFELDISDVFDAPVDSSPFAHDFQELQMRLLPGVLVDASA